MALDIAKELAAMRRMNAELTHRVAVPDLDTLRAQIKELRESERLYGNGNGGVSRQLEQLDGASRLLIDAQPESVSAESSDAADGVYGSNAEVRHPSTD